MQSLVQLFRVRARRLPEGRRPGWLRHAAQFIGVCCGLALLAQVVVAQETPASPPSPPVAQTATGPEPSAPAPAPAVPAPSETPKPVVDETKLFHQQIQQLKEENAALRRENQQLRRLLSERLGGAAASTNALAAMSDTNLVHWVTPGGKRHNRNCRYYQKAGGRPCGPHEGVACKICGG